MNRIIQWAVALVSCTTASMAMAGDIIVTSGGSIQDAIDIAIDGDVIQVEAGLYNENIDFLGKEITVIAIEGPSSTTISAAGSTDPAVTFAVDETNLSVLEGFSIAGGNVEFNGGGIVIAGTSPIIRACVVEGNNADSAGGGAHISLAAEPRFERCTFVNNTSDRGGGVFAENATPTFINCRFQSNVANRGGGIANVGGSNSIITQCLMFDNIAVSFGGAMFNGGGSDPVISNSTIVRNTAFQGGGMYLDGSGTMVVNTILWGNSDTSGMTSSAQIEIEAGTPTVNRSIVQGGWAGSGSNNLSADPKFVNFLGGNFRIDDFSPAIDAGDNTAVPVDIITDFADLPRFVQDEGVTDTGAGMAPFIDIGAYEHQINSELLLINVPANFPTIQEAINAAAPNAEIIVAPGTYPETITTKGKALTIRSLNPTNPASVAATTIDGGGAIGAGTVVTMDSDEGPDTILYGLTIRGGNSINGGGLQCTLTNPTVTNCRFMNNNAARGGGIYVFDATPIITGCLFQGNFAGVGGGIYAEDSDITVLDCDFVQNTCPDGGGLYNDNSDCVVNGCTFTGNNSTVGGGLFNTNSKPVIVDCRFENNTAIDGAGIVNQESSDSYIANCLFKMNAALDEGGALLIRFSDPVVVNCIFDRNTARYGAGINSGAGSSPSVATCTFVGNIGKLAGGGVHNSDDDKVAGLDISNSILWQNAPDQIFESFGSSATVRFTDVEGAWPGANNLNADPMFVSPGSGNYRLKVASPCIDVGDQTLLPIDFADLDGDLMQGEKIPYDFNGSDRVVGFDVDLGAYELTGTDCVGDCSPDNGDGT
ncbi:MAG: hypothetical protein KC983_05555, partial [Phycisphaerales bacterium]|nr:hypothetical protein [Phycisphaerales bacterium]